MLLAKDGIFPITKDQNGHLLSNHPASGFNFPGTIQGEGKLCGVPSLFIRLAGCNLRCSWTPNEGKSIPCDTLYAAYLLENTRILTIEEVYNTVLHNTPSIRHIVITGGEPFLQYKELKDLCCRLKQNNRFHITIETNATIFQEEVAQYVDLFSLSPKLSSSHPDSSVQPLNVDSIRSFLEYAQSQTKDFQLKFVYSEEADIAEIQEILSQLKGWKNEDILLMPLGASPDIMRINSRKALEYCIRNGWRYCDRLHISLFGDKQGV